MTRTYHAFYSDRQWSEILAILQSAGAELAAVDQRDCRLAMDSAAAVFSWERRGITRKEADRPRSRIATARRHIERLSQTPLGTLEAMNLAERLERELLWIFERCPAVEEFLSRVSSPCFGGYLVALEIELGELDASFQREIGYRERKRPTGFNGWLMSLAEIWERSGLTVVASGDFCSFVEAARTAGIRGGAITETTVRDFVLRQWNCRTPES